LRKRFWNFFTSHYAATALLVNLLLIFLAVELHAYGRDLKVTIPIVALLATLLVFDLRLKKQHDRRETRRLHKEFIDNLLEAAAASVLRVTQAQHMRACLMVADENNHLRITNSYGFSASDLDLGIVIPIGTGCSGQAWLQGKCLTADLEEKPSGGMPDQWGIPFEEAHKIRRTLKTILSVPVKAGSPYRVVAVLNLDSDDGMADTKFVDEQIQHIAYCFVKVLSSLMDETD
jgi:hypothetical protein